MSRRLSRPRRIRRSTAARPKDDRPTSQARLRAQGPADLLALIPFQLGFHPAESVVTVFLSSGQVKMTARVDLPPPAAAAEFARHLRWLVRQHDIEELVLFAYSAHPGPARTLLDGLVRALPARLVNDALYVDGSRWWSLTCDQACCPAEGTPYDVASSRLAAEAVYAGLTARASRNELAATLNGPREGEVAHLGELAADVRNELKQLSEPQMAERLERTLRAAMVDRNGLDDRTCAELALLVTDVRLRDLAWALISLDDAEDHVEIWLRVMSRIPPELSAAPLALTGIAGWIGGHGALLNCCADRLRDLHPRYSMGRLLADISEWAVSPSLWRGIGQEVETEVRRVLDGLAG
jgi:hypothetical protein